MKSVFIDWTEQGLHFYVFQKKAGQYSHVDTFSHRAEGDLDAVALRSMATETWDPVYLSVPVNLLSLREQSFPFSDRNKIKDTIPFELEGLLLGSVRNYIIDHTITESSDSGSKVIAASMEKPKIREIIDTFSSAGLEPKVITSLDLRLSHGKSDALIGNISSDADTRTAAAGEEMVNPTINLRQNEFAYMGDIDKLIKKLRSTAVLVLLFLVIVAANSFMYLSSLKKENASLASEIQQVYHRVFPEDKKIIDAERQFRGNMNTLVKKKEALGGIPVLDVLRSIAERKDTSVTLYEFNADGKNFIIKGRAKTFEDVEALKNSFMNDFREVKVTNSEATADKMINFTIIMQGKTA